MEREAVQAWIDAYLDAWRSNTPEQIAALFAEDATYAYNPWEDPLRGRETIVADWLDEPDEPDSWEAEYRPMLVDNRRAIITGETRYADGKIYSNLFVTDFDDDGRCRAFTEWYMRHPK
jgi:ketosteroid isomerase-like protein